MYTLLRIPVCRDMFYGISSHTAQKAHWKKNILYWQNSNLRQTEIPHTNKVFLLNCHIQIEAFYGTATYK